MEEKSKPSTAAGFPKPAADKTNAQERVQQKAEAGDAKLQGRQTASEATSRNTIHRSVPPVHELTSHHIQYKPKSSIDRYQRSAPAPANMTYLPCAQEKLMQSRRFLAKVVGFDANIFEQPSRFFHPQSSYSPTLAESMDENISRYSNAFSSGRSPRGLRSSPWKEIEMSKSEILRGQGLPATPRLLRGGNSKNYGVRRQISSSNQLELSPDFNPDETPVRKSAIHFNTPADGIMQSSAQNSKEEEDPDKTSPEVLDSPSRITPRTGNYVSPFGEVPPTTPSAVTNRLMVRDRQRDAPWVYCYKIKRDRLKLSRLLTSKSVTDPAVDEMLPAF